MLRGAGGEENPSTHESSALMQAEKNAKPSPRERISLDFGWRFHLGNADDASKDFQFGESSILGKSGEFFEACRKDFDDSSWREIDLPHDWAVELPFESGEGHSDDVRKTLVDHGCKPLGRDFPTTSIGWYRRIFEIPASDLGRRISIEFDGIYRDAIVALNGHYVGRNLSGYAPARYDVTDWLNYGGKNYLVVRVDATENEGWFYEGAGIYRHVWMVKTNAVHFAHDGVFISADIGGQARLARLDIESEVVNQGKSEITCTVSCEWIGSDQNPGTVAGGLAGALRSRSKTIAAGTSTEYGTGVEMVAANLWSLESPYTYRAVMSLLAGDELLDRVEIPFGVRQIKFDVDKGFFLNGKRVAIQGTCNHQDHAGVGAALPDRLQYFRIQKLKEMGCNAIRTSHNPPTPELLDACDKLGMLVMDETRMMDSSEEGLSQLTRMVRRDRNHPCVILWSIGNEEPEQGTQRGARITETMKSVVKKLDPTRPVTAAMNGSWGKGISAVVDVQGFNYKILGSVDKFHADFPAKPCVGSEEASTVSTRGIYENDKARGYLSAYDLNHPPWGSNAEDWVRYFAARAWLAGAFVWTGFDYRGEPTPYSWPCISSHFGIMDTCGFPKDNFFYYQAWWQDKSVLHVFPHWNWAGKEGQPINVWVHSNCEEVELFLNGKSLERKPMTRLSHLEWNVPYAAGTLLARGFSGGKQIAEMKVETAGAAAGIRLTADREKIGADGKDVSVITAAIVDVEGRVVPAAGNEMNFELSGPGKIIGVGNGNPTDHSADKPEAPFTSAARAAFNGFAQVIVQSARGEIDSEGHISPGRDGAIQLSANSAGLSAARVTIHAARNSVAMAAHLISRGER